MKISELNPKKLSDEQKTNLLFTFNEDDIEYGDCIFVPGSSKAVEYRLPKAVDLYQQGRAKKILFSGGVIWENSSFTEAEALKNSALELGVPAEDILVEKLSLHTKENVISSLLILDRAFGLHNLNRLLIVTTAHHMKRLHLSLKTYMPTWIKFSLCPVNDKTTRRENWFKYPHGRMRVEAEVNKLINYVKQGILIDEDVEL